MLLFIALADDNLQVVDFEVAVIETESIPSNSVPLLKENAKFYAAKDFGVAEYQGL